MNEKEIKKDNNKGIHIKKKKKKKLSLLYRFFLWTFYGHSSIIGEDDDNDSYYNTQEDNNNDDYDIFEDNNKTKTTRFEKGLNLSKSTLLTALQTERRSVTDLESYIQSLESNISLTNS